jgi:hypothetical protein
VHFHRATNDDFRDIVFVHKLNKLCVHPHTLKMTSATGAIL